MGLNATSIDQFLLENDGSLLSYIAATTASGSQSFGQMTFATINGIQYAYILDPNGAVYWCNINADGSFSNCTATAALLSFGTWQAPMLLIVLGALSAIYTDVSSTIMDCLPIAH